MSRGEEGTASEPAAAVETKDGQDKVGDNDKSPSVTQPAAAPAATTTGDSSSSGENKVPTSVPPAEAKSSAASGTSVNDRNTRDQNNSRALAKLPVRRVVQPGGKVDYRSRKSAGRTPVWVGPPPVIYGPSPEAMAPYAVNPADAGKRQDRMSSSPARAVWRRVVEAPGAVLDGGKQALYGVIDSIW